MKKIDGNVFKGIAIILLLGACISCKCKINGEKMSKSILPDTCNGTNFVKITSQDDFHVDYHNYWLIGLSIYTNYEKQVLKTNSSNSTCNFENTNILVKNKIIRVAVLPNKKMWILQLEDTASYKKYSISLTDTLGNTQLTRTIHKYSSYPHIVPTSDNGCIVIIQDIVEIDSIKMTHSANKNEILRFDANGNVVWQHEYYGNNTKGVIESSSKDIFVYGTSLDKYDKNGTLLWKKNYSCNSMIELPMNTFLISTYEIFKIDKDGAILWNHTITSNTNMILCKSGESDAIVCYSKYSKKYNSDIYLEKYNSDGQNLWKKSFGGTGDETLRSLLYIPLKGYYMIGTSKNYTGESTKIDGSTERCSDEWWNRSETSNYFVKTDLNGNTCN